VKIREILVPSDFSEHAEAALQYAMELARRLDARLHLLHVYQLELAMPWEDALRAGLLQDIKRYAEQAVTERGQQVAAQGVEVRTEALEGAPAAVIIDAARRTHADLIVMGTRGLSGIKHVVLGSVAERTVCHAPCPVLTIRAK
jgi:nucleotide-binding universal stress UspA family protein